MPQMSFNPAGPLSQQDLDDAGIPARILMTGSGPMVQMLSGSDPDDVQAVKALIAEKLGEPTPPTLNLEKAKLTDQWLMLKGCLAALPPAPDEGYDAYADARARLTDQIEVAETNMNNAGGPG